MKTKGYMLFTDEVPQIDIKHTKRKLRELKKVKKALRKGTEEYKKVKTEIKTLKHKLADVNQESPEKDKLIAEINELTAKYLRGIINLRNYTVEQLQLHLTKLKQRSKK